MDQLKRLVDHLFDANEVKYISLTPGRMKTHRPIRLKRLIFTVLIFTFIAFTLINFISLYALPLPSQYMLLNPALGYYSSVSIAIFDTSMARLSIVDIATKDFNNKTIIYRRLMNGNRRDITISEVALVQPDDVNVAMLDTTKLKVDMRKLSVPARPLISPPFITGSLSSDRNATSDVLMIGLGGSQMNNFLHHLFPQMNITIIEIEYILLDMARKYFGLFEDVHQHVIIMDGLDYLEEAVKEGRKFDAIYIDACPTDFPSTEEVLCPVHGFLNHQNIVNIKAALKETGTLTLKILVFSKNVTAMADNIAQRYRLHFPVCIIKPMLSEFNRVLVCSSSELPKELLDEEKFNKAQNEFYEKFGLIGGKYEF